MSKNFVFIQSANLDDLPLASMLSSPLLSEQVRTQAARLSGVRQTQFVACRYLLAEILNHYFDISYLPNIVIGNNQRPQFDKANLPDFNISHSHNYVAVGVSSQGRLGLDIELKRTRKNFMAIAKQFFSAQENQWLNEQADPLDAFWQLWTLRESALKLYAKGVWQMKEMQIEMPKQRITTEFAEAFYAHHQTVGAICLSVCSNQPIDILEINQ